MIDAFVGPDDIERQHDDKHDAGGGEKLVEAFGRHQARPGRRVIQAATPAAINDGTTLAVRLSDMVSPPP